MGEGEGECRDGEGEGDGAGAAGGWWPSCCAERRPGAARIRAARKRSRACMFRSSDDEW